MESPLPKNFQEQSIFSESPAVTEISSRKRIGRKKDSEWVFRPLKLKFKVKELEHLYNNTVYRQRQSLLLGACVLMSILSLLVLLVYLIKAKVCFAQPFFVYVYGNYSGVNFTRISFLFSLKMYQYP